MGWSGLLCMVESGSDHYLTRLLPTAALLDITGGAKGGRFATVARRGGQWGEQNTSS